MRVRAGCRYRFNPVVWDRVDPKTDLKKGDVVTVVNLPGAPPANTMGHCHVNGPDGEFAGLVHCNSLESLR
jgi:hypothetical protein